MITLQVGQIWVPSTRASTKEIYDIKQITSSRKVDIVVYYDSKRGVGCRVERHKFHRWIRDNGAKLKS